MKNRILLGLFIFIIIEVRAQAQDNLFSSKDSIFFQLNLLDSSHLVQKGIAYILNDSIPQGIDMILNGIKKNDAINNPGRLYTYALLSD